MGKPKIRFKGYNDEWEQRKLGEVAQEFKSGNFLKADEIDIAGDYPVYGGNGLRGYTSTYNHDGEFALIGRQGALCGNMNYSVGKAYFTEHAVVVEADENNDTRFLYCMLDIMNLGQYSDQSAQPGLAVNKLIKLENFFPQKEEQQQIGWYFNTLDHLITLHQRKCDEMKTLKKYMLQKMFPQNGQKIPEIRFEGFTGEWEQRKCKDIFDRVSKAVDVEAGEVYREIGIRSHGKGLFYKDEITGEGLGNKRVFWVEPNSFILNIVFAWERAVTKTTEKELGMIASHRFPMYKPKENVADLDYITKFFITHKGKYILEMASPGGAGRNKTLGQKEFENSTICLPSYEEQKKIGRYLEVFDHLITLHQRKCDKLKSIKKFMLQNMFV